MGLLSCFGRGKKPDSSFVSATNDGSDMMSNRSSDRPTSASDYTSGSVVQTSAYNTQGTSKPGAVTSKPSAMPKNFEPRSVAELHPEYAHGEPYHFTAKTESARLVLEKASGVQTVIRGPSYRSPTTGEDAPKVTLVEEDAQTNGKVHAKAIRKKSNEAAEGLGVGATLAAPQSREAPAFAGKKRSKKKSQDKFTELDLETMVTPSATTDENMNTSNSFRISDAEVVSERLTKSTVAPSPAPMQKMSNDGHSSVHRRSKMSAAAVKSTSADEAPSGRAPQNSPPRMAVNRSQDEHESNDHDENPEVVAYRDSRISTPKAWDVHLQNAQPRQPQSGATYGDPDYNDDSINLHLGAVASRDYLDAIAEDNLGQDRYLADNDPTRGQHEAPVMPRDSKSLPRLSEKPITSALSSKKNFSVPARKSTKSVSFREDKTTVIEVAAPPTFDEADYFDVDQDGSQMIHADANRDDVVNNSGHGLSFSTTPLTASHNASTALPTEHVTYSPRDYPQVPTNLDDIHSSPDQHWRQNEAAAPAHVTAQATRPGSKRHSTRMPPRSIQADNPSEQGVGGTEDTGFTRETSAAAKKRQSLAVRDALSQQIRGVPRSAMLAMARSETDEGSTMNTVPGSPTPGPSADIHSNSTTGNTYASRSIVEEMQTKVDMPTTSSTRRSTKSIRMPPQVQAGKAPPPPPPPPFSPDGARVKSVRAAPVPPNARKSYAHLRAVGASEANSFDIPPPRS